MHLVYMRCDVSKYVSLDIYKRRQTRYKTVTMAPDGGRRHHCNQHQISAGTGELSADTWTSVT